MSKSLSQFNALGYSFIKRVDSRLPVTNFHNLQCLSIWHRTYLLQQRRAGTRLRAVLSISRGTKDSNCYPNQEGTAPDTEVMFIIKFH